MRLRPSPMVSFGVVLCTTLPKMTSIKILSRNFSSDSHKGMSRVAGFNDVKGMAGRQGFEPRYAGPEPAVLPLDDLPTSRDNKYYRTMVTVARAICN